LVDQQETQIIGRNSVHKQNRALNVAKRTLQRAELKRRQRRRL
jgi:hypothetical protein